MTHLRLKCPKCGNIIEIEETGEKAQRVVCDKCGGRFILREKPKVEYEKREEPFKRDSREKEKKPKFFSDLGDPYNPINLFERNNEVSNMDYRLQRDLKKISSEIKFCPKFCPNCGSKIDFKTEICPNCGVRVKLLNVAKFCPNCGEKIDRNAEICPNCGVKIALPIVELLQGRTRKLHQLNRIDFFVWMIAILLFTLLELLILSSI